MGRVRGGRSLGSIVCGVPEPTPIHYGSPYYTNYVSAGAMEPGNPGRRAAAPVKMMMGVRAGRDGRRLALFAELAVTTNLVGSSREISSSASAATEVPELMGLKRSAARSRSWLSNRPTVFKTVPQQWRSSSFCEIRQLLWACDAESLSPLVSVAACKKQIPANPG